MAEMRSAVDRVAERQTEHSFIRDISTEAGEHIKFKEGGNRPHALDDDALAWTDRH